MVIKLLRGEFIIETDTPLLIGIGNWMVRLFGPSISNFSNSPKRIQSVVG